MKRSHLELEVAVKVAEFANPSRELYTLHFAILELAHLDYFLNAAQLVEEEDVLHVDLCQQGLSPWPICGCALVCLVNLFKPLSMVPEERLATLLSEAGTTLAPVLLAADALSLRKQGSDSLDPWVRDHLSAHPVPLMTWTEVGDDWVGPELRDTWASSKQLKTPGGSVSFQHSLVPATKLLVPAARWAALEMFCLLDQLQLAESRQHVAEQIVCPGRKLLYGDQQWRSQLQQLNSSGRLSKEGQNDLFAAALDAEPESVRCAFEVTTLSMTIKEALTTAQPIAHTNYRIEYDVDACNCWMPLTIHC